MCEPRVQLRARGRAPTPALRCSTAPLCCRSSHRARSACGSHRQPEGCSTRHSCSRCRLCAFKNELLGMSTGPQCRRSWLRAGWQRLGWTGARPGAVWQANRAEGRPGFTCRGARWGRVDATRAEVALDVANVMGVRHSMLYSSSGYAIGLPFRAAVRASTGALNATRGDASVEAACVKRQRAAGGGKGAVHLSGAIPHE